MKEELRRKVKLPKGAVGESHKRNQITVNYLVKIVVCLSIMKKIRIMAVLLAAIISLAGFAQQVEVKNNSFYINGNSSL